MERVLDDAADHLRRETRGTVGGADGPPYPIFFRAGAALPTGTSVAYIRKIRAAGSFKRYGQNHLAALTTSFEPKFLVLPKELVRRVVEYAFHVGDY